MSRDQRVQDNWALLHAAEQAAKSGAGVAVAFNLVPAYVHAGARQFCFMLRALEKVEPKLKALNIPFYMLQGDPTETLPKLVADSKASLLVTDFAPLRLGREWRDKVAESISIPFHEVDAHCTVPTWLASNKRETGARTIRPKIHKHLPEFLTDFPEVPKQPEWKASRKLEPVDWKALIKNAQEKGKEVPEMHWVEPGEDAAMEALTGKDGFLQKERLENYDALRNKPMEDATSNLSGWLHFGHLSQQRVGLEAGKHKSAAKGAVDSLQEELLVRGALAENFCFYEPKYDSLECAADWAKDSLEKHKGDKREWTYTEKEFEDAKTHDDLWNAAQREMTHLGKMHGFMRMYWAKCILAWSESPEEALRISIYLNDRYELDGRDPNGYVGCLWAVCGIHDQVSPHAVRKQCGLIPLAVLKRMHVLQGWGERPVFGKVRCMNYNGCKRKFKIQAYIDGVENRIKNLVK
eukprot:jgi/Astpho2/939/Aster-00776